jgi:hypothetical protein
MGPLDGEEPKMSLVVGDGMGLAGDDGGAPEEAASANGFGFAPSWSLASTAPLTLALRRLARLRAVRELDAACISGLSSFTSSAKISGSTLLFLAPLSSSLASRALIARMRAASTPGS